MTAAIPEIQVVRERITRASASPSPLWGEVRGAGSPASGSSSIYNAPWNEIINTENLALIAEMLTRSALAREESRGAHYRSDFPEKEVHWLKNICMTPRSDGSFDLSYAPVKFTRLAPPAPEEKNMGLKTVVSLIDE
jgi:hypothetical protein